MTIESPLHLVLGSSPYPEEEEEPEEDPFTAPFTAPLPAAPLQLGCAFAFLALMALDAALRPLPCTLVG